MRDKKVYLGKIEEFHFFYEQDYSGNKLKRYNDENNHDNDSCIGFIYINESMDNYSWSFTRMSQLYKRAFEKFKRLNLFIE
jgi:hypothetical protein